MIQVSRFSIKIAYFVVREVQFDKKVKVKVKQLYLYTVCVCVYETNIK